MKNKLIFSILTGFLLFSCNTLDLNPLSEGSSENWYSNDIEVQMSLDRLYVLRYWNPNPDPINWDNCSWIDAWTDDFTNRTNLSAVTGGTITGVTSCVTNLWTYYYQCIAAANLLLEKIEKNKANFTEANYNKYTADARFVRACQYSFLITRWGDVPYYTKTLTIDEAFSMGRTPKADVLKGIYADFDFAATNLPKTYSNSKHATKGAAYAMKARIALYMGDNVTARDAAKACMDLNQYQLFSDFPSLFYTKTRNSTETVLGIPRSLALGVFIGAGQAKQPMMRTASGNDYTQPSWDLFNAFLCTDGKQIDESPLYNPQLPFKNRDPRLKATIVEFGTPITGFIYQPHPDSLKTTNVKTGVRVSNLDSRGVGQYASFNGLAFAKGIDDDWSDDWTPDPEQIVIRYADVLLMYAEAKIELGGAEIDQSVIDAINKVRARAYKVDYTKTTLYPAVTSTNQAELRRILRFERRMEFACEGLRYNDIIRWKTAEKVLNTTMYGMIDPPEQREKIIKTGLWFFPEVVPIDDDGVSNFSSLFSKGYIKILAQRSFDKNKHYLWPIPTPELLINPNLKDNPGY
jgi:starch-binding outer membrane protein, SusD/RagB family